MEGCKVESAYNFKGEINGEKLEFNRKYPYFITNELKVMGKDGKIIDYIDNRNDDLQLDKVVVTLKNGEIKTYNKDFNFAKPIMEKAQEKFINYLKEITQYKTSQGLEELD